MLQFVSNVLVIGQKFRIVCQISQPANIPKKCFSTQNVPFDVSFQMRQPTVEDDLRWKTTIDGRWPSVEDDLQGKTTFGGRQPLLEEDLRWRMSFIGRWPLLEDNPWWKTTCGGRQHSVQEDLIWIMACCLLRSALLHFWRKKIGEFL